jgi:acyl-CoA synthetase
LSFSPEEAARYRADGWWQDDTVGTIVGRRAVDSPDGIAIGSDGDQLTWAEYDALADELAGVLAWRFDPGERVVVLLPDGGAVHVAFVAAERAGVVVVGIGWRAGDGEVSYLATLTGATGIVTHAERPVDVEVRTRIDVPRLGSGGPVLVDGAPVGEIGPPPGDRQLGPDDLFLLNSTSGTTGRPKCVMHTQNRWFAFHRMALEAGGFGRDEVFLSAIPAPYGFGLWTAHFTPAILGCPVHVLPRFSAESAVELIERRRVTVLCCVSTQFIMMLNTGTGDLTSLRSMFTGGEAVPYHRALEFEQRTGARVLQFYGSNETGALSRTTIDDTPERRLTTAGRVIDVMDVKLYDTAGAILAGRGQPGSGQPGSGQPGCRGPVNALGYWGDEAANRQLFTADGSMLMGDIVEIDDDGYLKVIGRTSDFIIRGGKNISAPEVEDQVSAHPAVVLAAVVGAPDPVFGERVAVFVSLHGGHTLTLDELRAHLEGRGVTREWWPEHLVVLDDLPRSSGGKVAKGELREEIRRRLDAEVHEESV